MGFGGRPRIDGGHAPRRFSLDKETRETLDQASEQGKPLSEIVERCVKTLAEQYDPGESCETVRKVLSIVEGDLRRAYESEDWGQVQAIAQLRKDLDPYARTCQIKRG